MRDVQSEGGLEWFDDSVNVTRTSHLPFVPENRESLAPAEGVAPSVDHPASGITHRPVPPAVEPARYGLGYTALLMGILGLATPWLPIRAIVPAPQATLWLPFLGIVFAPLAIVFGILGGARFRKGSVNNKKMATAGLALGLFYLVLLGGVFLFVLISNTYH